MLSRRFILCISLFLAISYANAGYGEQTFVIFTLNHNIPEISRAKAKMLYTGKLKSIKPVGRVQLMDWQHNSSERASFYRQLANKTTGQINSLWASAAFSGKAKPPTPLQDTTSAAITQWLQDQNNGIAYAPQEDIPVNSKILLIVK